MNTTTQNKAYDNDALRILRISIARIAQAMGVDNELKIAGATYEALSQKASIERGWNQLAALCVDAALARPGASQETTHANNAAEPEPMNYGARFPDMPGYACICSAEPEYALEARISIHEWFDQGAVAVERIPRGFACDQHLIYLQEIESRAQRMPVPIRCTTEPTTSA